MTKRARFSRWRRLPGVFRTGELRPIGSGTELDRIILYVPAGILDLAEVLAEKAGVASVQDYCALLLMEALENERVKKRVAEFEERRGALEGLKQIADDPDYLAEWQRRSEARAERAHGGAGDSEPEGSASRGSRGCPAIDLVFSERKPSALNAPAEEGACVPGEQKGALDALPIRVESVAGGSATESLKPMVLLINDLAPQEILAHHVGSSADDHGFLPCLRRGEAIPAAKVAELSRALMQLEDELRGAPEIDRRVAHALHRLGLESQVLLTDAWPGVFDERVIADIRTVQESVERILSGQDIRYYPTANPAGGSEQPT
jgi:hypothetical protein